MAFVSLAKLLVLLQLSLLLCSSVTVVYGDEALYPPVKPPVKPPTYPPEKPPVKPPTYPPEKPPVKPPTYPPEKPPVKPPTYPPEKPPVKPKKVAVEGVVYCKPCKYIGVNTLNGAVPLARAVVKLQCKSKKLSLVEQVKTDKNGYFFFMPEKLTKPDSHKCKVVLVSSPHYKCSVPTNLHNGAVGAILKPSTKPSKKTLPFELFTVGPFAFEPTKKVCYY